MSNFKARLDKKKEILIHMQTDSQIGWPINFCLYIC